MKYNFTQTPSQKEYWDNQFAEDAQIYIKSQQNINRLIIRECSMRFEEGNVIVSITGQTGSGKSWAALSLAEFFYELFDTQKRLFVFFETEPLLDAVSETQAGDTIIMDEQRRSNVGHGSHTRQNELVDIEEQIRKAQVNLIYCSPSLRKHQHHLIVKTHSLDKRAGVSKLMVYTPAEESLWGYITLKKPNTKWVTQYEKKKDKWLDTLKKRDYGKSTYEAQARKLMQNEQWNKCTNRKQQMMVCAEVFGNITIKEQQMIVEKARLMDNDNRQ